MGRPVPEPYSVVFECSGKAAAAESALDQVDFGGTFVFVGTGHEQPRVNHNRVIILELDAPRCLQLRRRRAGGPRSTCSRPGAARSTRSIDGDDVLLDGLLPAMERLAAGEIPAKVMVVPEVSHMTSAMNEEATFKPRLNHVAFTMDRSLLDDAGRAEILDFYGDVFGWTEGDNSMEQGNPLILYTGAVGPSSCTCFPATSRCSARASITSASRSRRAKNCEASSTGRRARQATDDRVSIIDVKSRTHPR